MFSNSLRYIPVLQVGNPFLQFSSLHVLQISICLLCRAVRTNARHTSSAKRRRLFVFRGWILLRDFQSIITRFFALLYENFVVVLVIIFFNFQKKKSLKKRKQVAIYSCVVVVVVYFSVIWRRREKVSSSSVSSSSSSCFRREFSRTHSLSLLDLDCASSLFILFFLFCFVLFCFFLWVSWYGFFVFCFCCDEMHCCRI